MAAESGGYRKVLHLFNHTCSTPSFFSSLKICIAEKEFKEQSVAAMVPGFCVVPLLSGDKDIYVAASCRKRDKTSRDKIINLDTVRVS